MYYNWRQFTDLPAVKNLDKGEQMRQYYRYQNKMNEKTSTSAAASSSAAGAGAGAGAGGAGGGGHVSSPQTSGSSVLFLDDVNENWEYFLVDENNVKTNVVDTGLSSNDIYLNDTCSGGYPIKNGYVIKMNNDNDKTWFLFIGENGQLVRRDELTSWNDDGEIDGRFYYYTTYVDSITNIVIFDGVKLYEYSYNGFVYQFNADDSAYTYDTNSFYSDTTYGEGDTLLNGLVFVNTDSYEFYFLGNENPITLFTGDGANDYYGSWSAGSNNLFMFEYSDSTSKYLTIKVYGANGLKSTLDVSSEQFISLDWFSYGQNKIGGIFYDSGEVNYYKIFTYNNDTNEFLTKEYSNTGYYFDYFFDGSVQPFYGGDFYCLDKLSNYRSDNVLFTFYDNNTEYNDLYYWDNFDAFPVFNGATAIGDPIQLGGGTSSFGLDSYRGMFTENTFTMLADSGNGNISELLITREGLSFNDLGFAKTDVNSWDYFRLYDSFVYKFFFSGVQDLLVVNNTYGATTSVLNLTNVAPNNTFVTERELMLVNDNNNNITYYLNDTTNGEFVSLGGYYFDQIDRTFYNTADGLKDGKVLLYSGCIGDIILLTGTSSPVNLDFSFLYSMDSWNIYLNDTYILLQYRDYEGIGYAKTYGYDGNVIQDEINFGHCEWISADLYLGYGLGGRYNSNYHSVKDNTVLRFTSWCRTKRVFFNANGYKENTTHWGYSHKTIFNDYLWYEFAQNDC